MAAAEQRLAGAVGELRQNVAAQLDAAQALTAEVGLTLVRLAGRVERMGDELAGLAGRTGRPAG